MKRLFVAAAFALNALTAQAAVVTSIPGATAMPLPSQFVNAWQGAQTFAPGVVWTSTDEYAMAGSVSYYGFGYNGLWSGIPMIGSGDDVAGVMTLSFSSPIYGIVGLFNYSPSHGAASISAYDVTHTLIETKVLNFSTDRSLLNQGAYLGFLESSANISYFTMSGAYISGADFSILGNPAPIPETETYAMLLVGLGLVGFVVNGKRVRA